MSKFINIVGKVFGKLTVIEKMPITSKNTYFKCSCSCGNESIVRSQHLRNRTIKSCGCIKTTHHKSRTKIYKTWINMRYRCNNPTAPNYKLYGGRGITICDEWADFAIFLKDMGEPPTKNHTIERMNNKGNYSPKNCKWATRKEQSNNTRTNIRVECHGSCHTIAEWSDITTIPHHVLRRKFKQGILLDYLYRKTKYYLPL